MKIGAIPLCAGLFVVILGALVAADRINKETVPMKCKTLEPEEVTAEHARLTQRKRYVPTASGQTSVQFKFNLTQTEVGESLFMIYSNRAGKAMYWGPYRAILSVGIDENLVVEKGYDNLEFQLLQLEHQQLCRWSNERGYPYWRAGDIGITFLRKQILDEDGLVKTFEVTIR